MVLLLVIADVTPVTGQDLPLLGTSQSHHPFSDQVVKSNAVSAISEIIFDIMFFQLITYLGVSVGQFFFCCVASL